MADPTLPGFSEAEFPTAGARARKLSPEEIAEKEGNRTVLSMVMPSEGLNRALVGNQFKNRFEHGAELMGINAGSERYDSLRKSAEEYLFDVPEQAPGSMRPIYGFLRHAKDTSFASEEYGDALVDIKHPRPDQRVTVTHRDSLNGFMDDDWDHTIPERLTKEHQPYDHEYDPESHGEYHEVQWHDRPSPREDITAVHYPHQMGWMPPELLERNVSRQLESHAVKAGALRRSGLPQSTPIHSSVTYTTRYPGLFDEHPEALENNWNARPETHTVRREF